MQIPSDAFHIVNNKIFALFFLYNHSLLEGQKIVETQISMDEGKRRPKMIITSKQHGIKDTRKGQYS